MLEQFERLALLFSKEEINKIENATVCIVGLGGVGSASALCLARCGVSNFILCDYDKVQISNINRQLIANINTIGEYKALVCERMIKEINPSANIYCIINKYAKELKLFNFHFDYLIDAIDDVTNKFDLMNECIENNVVFISSMGTAKKLDLKKLSITKLSKTEYDPLARVLRKKFKDNNKKELSDKIIVLSSTETPKEGRLLGSYMPVTSTSGLMLADYIIKKIIE